jgi:hypothetical protein
LISTISAIDLTPDRSNKNGGERDESASEYPVAVNS